MEICFNELSIYPYCIDLNAVNQRVDTYVQVIKEAIKLGAKKIRYEYGLSGVMLMENLSLDQYCFDKRNKNKGDFLMSCVKKPYIDEKSEFEDLFTKYDDANLKKKETELITCYGFYAAFLYNSFCVGFCSEPYWIDSSFTLQLTKNEKTIEVSIICISQSDEFNKELFINWAINNIQVSVPQTPILPRMKKVSLRDDHGNDILKSFADSLKNCSYIKSVINSLPFNPQETNFIHNVYEDGKIELVLTETDQGLGLIVETTATNMLETKWVAKHLKTYFGY
jgi:hypothetical protein